MTRDPVGSVYVIGSASELLERYIEKHGLDVPALREQLAPMRGAASMSIQTWWDLLNQIQAANPVSGLGLDIGRCVEPHHLGVLGYLVTYCDTIEQALMRFSRFQSLLHNLVPSIVVTDEHTLTLFFDAKPIQSTQLADEVVFAGLLSFIRTWVADPDFSPVSMQFRYPKPQDVTPYRNFFNCEVTFGNSRTKISFSLDQARKVIRNQDSHLLDILEQQAQALMLANTRQDEWVARVQEHIASMLQQASPRLQDIATCMRLSERTLQRHLHDRQLRFKDLLSDVRFELAKKYLKDRRLSLTEISLLLGYAEQSVFTRSFKSWSNQTPLTYRNTFKSPQ